MSAVGKPIQTLATASRLDRKLVKVIVSGNYTPSPIERQRLAAARAVEDVIWGNAVLVQHMRGNGPQSGRPT